MVGDHSLNFLFIIKEAQNIWSLKVIITKKHRDVVMVLLLTLIKNQMNVVELAYMIHSIKTAVAQPRTIPQRINAANQASTICCNIENIWFSYYYFLS
jgi:hypothetical protein